MAYEGNYPPSTPLNSTQIGQGAVAPSNLTTGGPSWNSSGTFSINSSASTSPLQVSINSSSALYVDTSGNVGIGTTTPVTKLHVASNGAQTPTLAIPDATNNRYSVGIGSYNVSGVGQRMDFYTGDSGANGTNLSSSALRMSIDATGNVGIGTTSPAGKLAITTAASAANALVITDATNYTLEAGYGGSGVGFIGGTSSTALALWANNAEKARIDTSGNLLVATTDSGTTTGVGTKIVDSGRLIGTVSAYTTGANSNLLMYSTGASAYRFYVTWAGVINATSTSITGISDARLKENTAAITNGLDVVTKLNPITYNFKNLPVCDDGKVQHYGFLAQEVQSVLPTLVAEGLNELEDGSKYLTLKMGDMIPVLVAAIQELKAEFDAYKASHP